MNFLPAILAFLCYFSAEFCHALTSSITPDQPLKDPESITSENGTFRLGFFTPTNSKNRYLGIWYNQISTMEVIWVANRNNPLSGSSSSSGGFKISDNGNLQVVNDQNQIFWSSNLTNSASNSSLAKLLDTGNLVLYAENHTIIWQSFEHPTDKIMPYMTLLLTMNSSNQALNSWKSPSDPSEGRFSVGLNLVSVPQAIIWDSDRPFWRSGPWNGNTFIGMHMNGTFRSHDITVENNGDGSISMTYLYPYRPLSNYDLNYNGTITKKYWNDEKKDWQVLWHVPDGECDLYGKCGEYGSCNRMNKPICQCFKGFEPKNKEEYRRGNSSGGCARRTPLQCGNPGGKEDGFLKTKNMKVPDHEEWWPRLDQEQCGNQCLQNCSCLAYAYDTSVGCMTWSKSLVDTQESDFNGFNLYLRLAHSELGQNRKTKVIISMTAISVIAAIAILVCFIWKRKSQRQGNKVKWKKMLLNLLGDKNTQVKIDELPLFKLEELATAANNFEESNKLGEGGFGPVFKGKLENGQEIAIKRLSRASGQGVEEFINEAVVISKLQHRNLVRLLGCCLQGDEKMLIYEYMPNKSLDAFLFGLPHPLKREILKWKKRFDIIEGICRGLLYLHRDSRLRIIHRDLKASNILLDEELNPKISDFGIARIFGVNQHQANTKRVIGTYGYMSPEYAMEGRFSEKSDVFSFGVLLLEIISGERNTAFWYEEKSLTLLGYAWKLWKEGNLASLIDVTIMDSDCQEEILKCIWVGLLCVQELAIARPYISTVISMLHSEIADLPLPQQPGFTQRQIASDSGSSSQDQPGSINNLTISVVSAR